LPLQPSGSHCGGVRANKTVSVREASDATTKHLIGDIALKLDLDRQREHARSMLWIGTDDDSLRTARHIRIMVVGIVERVRRHLCRAPGAVRLNRDGGS